ncbi:hypothetical protein OPKNFCMD_3258 [Methylobacterium crusticola]|uniref:Transposase n=1 Tax=Methylobacterium crusticola TaxID=1697972 RepID=A0ABQ4R0P0_9HYPH|nr:hypothetical protein [Methylobacterium crusticola]GJD50515.1 hypothetical protein OPKNFCMD_3258 [Methylobacterium crusticola]
MPLKFYGSYKRLRQIVSRCGIEGVWRYIEANDQHQFKAATGEHLNWWPSSNPTLPGNRR